VEKGNWPGILCEIDLSWHEVNQQKLKRLSEKYINCWAYQTQFKRVEGGKKSVLYKANPFLNLPISFYLNAKLSPLAAHCNGLP